MPDGTVSLEYERYDLKSLPPDGFIMVRPLPYGLKLNRRDRASRMSMEAGQDTRKRTSKVDIELMQRWSREYEFKFCIGDHNITNSEGKKVDLTNPGTLDILSPKLGAEIEKILDELNAEDEDEDKDFPGPASISSKEATHHSDD
jgi:hypothetical protein